MAWLSRESLEFARTHITHFWDSDFYPKAHEYQAIWAHWDEVTQHLTSSPTKELPVRIPRIMTAPKPGGGHRIVHQLDPLDTLVYTALTYKIAPAVEAARPSRELRIACSYRIELDERRGDFFHTGNGFSEFVTQSRLLATQFPAVLALDLADFYNQINLHRLQNAISVACSDEPRLADALEDFLTRINGRVSRGVPVGPAASIVLAEAVLTDVDRFISERGFRHTRYVDDFNIFGERHELEALYRDLIIYLHNAHRLTVTTSKTGITTSHCFLTHVLDDPDARERERMHRQLERVRSIDCYDFGHGRLIPGSGEDIAITERTRVLKDFMTVLCTSSPLNLGLARHVLRRCRSLRIRAIVPQLLEHFDHFAPVINDVCLYLKAVSNVGLARRHARRITEISEISTALDSPLVALWWFEYVVSQKTLIRLQRVQAAIRDRGNFQSHASLALATRNVAWVREHRSRMDELGAWDRRHVIRASTILARDERKAWLYSYSRSLSPGLEKWVAQSAINRMSPTS